MSKNAISLIFVIAVLFQASGIAYSAALTDPDDMSKVTKLGLTIATAGAEGKISIKDAKETAGKAFDDWTWNYVVGNYEKLLTQNADAEIPDFKGKIDELQGFLELIGDLATKLGEGSYEEAAFKLVDEAVGRFDHPVVTVLWASVKLTYESHKLVQDTKAELQIEALYGKVENDMRLMGVSSGDSPKQIQINTETVDRFFYNYLVKDADTRELMKPYVQITLGQEWPEISTTDWLYSFTLLGTDLDPQKDYEVEQFTQYQTEFKQWIGALLNDINKQAKVRWAATRAIQQKAELDAYASKLKGFSSVQIIESFKKRKEMLKVKKYFPKFLAESSAAYQKLSNEFGSLKPSQIIKMQEIYSAAVAYNGKADKYSIIALMVDDLPLSNELEKQTIIWGKFANDISRSIKVMEGNTNTILQGAIEETNQEMVKPEVADPKEHAIANAAASYASTYGKIILKPFDWYSVDLSLSDGRVKRFTPEEAQSAVLAALNEGDFSAAEEIINVWSSTLVIEIDNYRKQMADKLQKVVVTTPDDVTADIIAVNEANETGQKAAKKTLDTAITTIEEKIGQLRIEAQMATELEEKAKANLFWRWYSGSNEEADANDKKQIEAARIKRDVIDSQIAAMVTEQTDIRKNFIPFQPKISILAAGWYRAHPILGKAVELLIKTESFLYEDSLSNMNKSLTAFKELKKFRAEELNTLRATLKKIYPKLEMKLADDDNKPVIDQINNKPKLILGLEAWQKHLKDNTYTYLGNLNTEGYSLISIDSYMEQKAAEIMILPSEVVTNLDGDIINYEWDLDGYVTDLKNNYPDTVKKWQEGLNDWSKIEAPDTDAVNQFIVLVDKNFDNDREILSIDNRAKVIQNYSENIPDMVKNFASSAQTEIFNRSQDADYLRAMATQWRTWLHLQIENGTFTSVPVGNDRFDGDLRIKDTDTFHIDFTSGMLIMHKPYYHYATEKELADLPQVKKARQDLQKLKVYSFIKSNMPSYAAKLESLLSGKNITLANEDNFFVNNNHRMVVYKSDLDKVSSMLPGINPETDDFINKLKEVSVLLPGTIIAQTPEEVKAELEERGEKYFGKFYEFSNIRREDMEVFMATDKSQYNCVLGKQYLNLVGQITSLIDKRRALISKREQKEAEDRYKSERVKYFNDEIEKMNKGINTLPENSITEDKVNKLYTDFWNLRSLYINEKLTGLDASFKLLEDKIISLKGRSEGIANQNIQQVKDFYSSFKQAYESRNDSQVMSFMGDEWEAGDGTTLSDLQMNLSRTFRTFDEVGYNIQNLVANKMSDRKYAVSYEVTITSRIYSRNIKHEEKSSVNEEVTLDDAGRPKISRTLNGRFWYVE